MRVPQSIAECDYLGFDVAITQGSAEECAAAPGREDQTQEHFYTGALARAVWTEETEDFSPRYGKVETRDGRRVAVDFA